MCVLRRIVPTMLKSLLLTKPKHEEVTKVNLKVQRVKMIKKQLETFNL